ncbi:MAG: RNA polymerase sigma-70 factor, partial [Muribaculaceae bacterium]|nr:RNA polymerase sigma-70 factor [Muribaculaceae bacterium]
DFDTEYKKLLVPLGMFALRIVLNVADAEDIVQSVFINTWQMISEGREPNNLKSYLYCAVRNASLKYIENKNKVITADISVAEEVSEEEINTAERDARLWNAINDLPQKCREIFLMCKRDGMSYKETAETLGISIKTVENQMSKALKSLRKAYGVEDKNKQNSLNSIFFLIFL